MKAKLFIPVGLPGCGKSTFYQRVLKHLYMVHHETDAIRQEVHPGVDFDPKLNSKVFDTFHQRVGWSLSNDLDVYADSTNLQDFARSRLRDIGAKRGADLHLLVFTNSIMAVERNMHRDRVVPPEVMVRMLEQYEKALNDIPHEHYSSVTYIEGTT